MVSRRTLFKGMVGLGLGTGWPHLGHPSSPTKDAGPKQETMVGLNQVPRNAPEHFGRSASSIMAIEAWEDLLDDLDCEELATWYIGRGRRQVGEGEDIGEQQRPCPFCGCSSFEVRTHDYCCWACGAVGNALTLFSSLEGVSYGKAFRLLRGLLDSGELQGSRAQIIRLWALMEEVTKFFHHVLCERPEGQPGRQWLAEQNVPLETKEFGSLGYMPCTSKELAKELEDHLKTRGFQAHEIKTGLMSIPSYGEGVMIPIRQNNGKCWGFVKCAANPSPYEQIGKYRMRDLSANRYRRHIFPSPVWPQDFLRYDVVLGTSRVWDVILLRHAGLPNVVQVNMREAGSFRTALGLAFWLILPINLSFRGDAEFESLIDHLGPYHDRIKFLIVPEGQYLLDLFRTEGAQGLQERMMSPVSVTQLLDL